MVSAEEARRELARRELARREARRSLVAFCARMDEDYDPTLPHARIICEYLDLVYRNEIENLAIFMPPQHGKSYHFSQRFPAYALGASGGKLLIATTSYTIDIARKNSRAARALVDDPLYPFDIEMASDARAVDEWYTTAGGGVKAAGVGGSLTGFGAHLIGVDDPFKGMAEADRPNVRDEVWEWWQTTVSTRQRANTHKLLAQTRWHDDDLAGRILNTPAAKSWTVLALRSYAEADDPLGRERDEILWPGGPPPLSVANGEISSRGFAALYQQRPTASEGSIFKREWFAHRYRTPAEPKRSVIWVDGAWKDGVSNDRSAFGTWAFTGTKYQLRDSFAARMEYPDLERKVIDYYAHWKRVLGNLTLCVEDAASGTALIQRLRRETSIPIIGVPAKGSKESRAEAVTPLFEAGKVELPEDAPWLDEWVEEHLRFPAAKHDDLVDTTSGALGRLQDKAGGIFFAAV